MSRKNFPNLRSVYVATLLAYHYSMKIIVGLGNPGDAYRGTRHNVGFETMDKLAFDFGIVMKKNRRFRAEVGEGRIGGKQILLVKPMTYMNLSGEAVRQILNFYKLPPSEIIVVYDDVSLPVGDIRVRERGGANGQKGIINMISHLGTEEIIRVRIGVGEKPPSWTLSDYVLSRFLREEWDDMIKGVTKAGDAVQMILNEGTLAAMNFFNEKKSPEVKVLKTTVIKKSPEVEVRLEELSNGKRQIYKGYADAAKIDDEWDALIFLRKKGFAVPKPIRRGDNGIYLQYIENGAFWHLYKGAEPDAQGSMMKKFVKLLFDLHKIKAGVEETGFVAREISEIRRIIGEKNLGEKYAIFSDKIDAASKDVTEFSSCYIHRDFHPWNVLADKKDKLYVTDFALKQGDFRFDVAWTYMLMSRTGEPEFAKQFLVEYGTFREDVFEGFEFFKQLANLRWLVNVQPTTSDFMLDMIQIAEVATRDFVVQK
ncbi:MAG: aminoacyl-tRNA hydrolase [Defluviitaleaceae bacterium]|nr:aminoacyl-tRNA hydrolase [Defluviitaleaceae bacterium]